MNKFRVIAYASGLSAGDLKVHGTKVLTGLTGNAGFPSPWLALSVLSTAVTDLGTAIDAQKPGDSVSTSAVRDKKHELKRVLKSLAAYVEYTANGDETLALSSGFDISKGTTKGVKMFTAKNGSLSGTAFLESPALSRAAYVFQISPDPIAAWTDLDTILQSRYTATGLTPGQVYWFRVVVIDKDGKKNPSDPFKLMII